MWTEIAKEIAEVPSPDLWLITITEQLIWTQMQQRILLLKPWKQPRMYQSPLPKYKVHNWLGQFHPTPYDRGTHRKKTVPEKKKKDDDTTYCSIGMSMGYKCKGRLTTSEWDDNDNEEEQPRGTSKVVSITLAPSPQ